MLGQKQKVFKVHPGLSLDDLVPLENFYRQVEAKLDLSFVRELVSTHYAPRMGRPSIDPVVFFKLQLIMFFEGLRSERQLMETVNLNLAHRWYIGYDLGERVPDHSSLSKIRDRYGVVVFQKFFEKIVELCVQAGLVWGKELYFDGTKVQANAAFGSLIPRFYFKAKQHIEELFGQAASVAASPQANSQNQAPAGLQRWLGKYNGTRLSARRSISYKRKTDSQVSLTDPDASLMSRFTGDRAKLGYHTHLCCGWG